MIFKNCRVSQRTLVRLSNRTARQRRRPEKRLGVTNVTGLLLAFLSWSSLNVKVFWSFTKRLFKGRWILAESFLRQNYCHAVTLGLPSSLPGLLCSPSSRNFTIFHFQMLSTQWHLNISLSKIQAICAGGGEQSVLRGNSVGIPKKKVTSSI